MARLSSIQSQKLKGEFDWGNESQKKANFNRDMGRKLKMWLKETPDMILLLNKLPPKVIENIGLLEYLPNMVNLMDTFLEKANPLPVGKHSSDEFRTFENIAQPMEQLPNIDDYDDCFRINGKKYMIRSVSCTATHAEIYNCDMLKKHAECMQRYIDPAAVVVNHDNNWRLNTSIIDEMQYELMRRWGMIGHCGQEVKWISSTENIPTSPPSKPHILIEASESSSTIE